VRRLLSNSLILAALVFVAVATWMLSGVLTRDPSAETAADVIGRRAVDTGTGQGNERNLLRVSVQTSHARPVTREVTVSARTEPNRMLELRAEADGEVVEVIADRGARVAAGDPIVRLDVRDRMARLDEIEALIEQHELQYQAALDLRERQLLSEVQIAEARARLAGSRAELVDIRLQIRHTEIDAPFDAFVQDRSVELGDFVRIGDAVAELVDTDPLIIVGEVNEREIGSLAVGRPGTATLVDGTPVTGTIRYLSPVAAQGSRTFRVELAVANPDGVLRAGMTAQLQLATEDTEGHLLAPSLLTLADDGQIGVKSVDSSNTVRFNAVELLRSTEKGIWVTGLPSVLDVITVGQGFVIEGQLVDPVLLDEELKY
jgi:multidrug efflux system membrane fusion protein